MIIIMPITGTIQLVSRFSRFDHGNLKAINLKFRNAGFQLRNFWFARELLPFQETSMSLDLFRMRLV